jgi:hypothetical protein
LAAWGTAVTSNLAIDIACPFLCLKAKGWRALAGQADRDTASLLPQTDQIAGVTSNLGQTHRAVLGSTDPHATLRRAHAIRTFRHSPALNITERHDAVGSKPRLTIDNPGWHSLIVGFAVTGNHPGGSAYCRIWDAAE